MMKPNIINIQKFSIHDGPGIRTTIFFKGCPLSCLWCHNPESQNFQREFLFDREKCTGCGYCIKGCQDGAISLLKYQDAKMRCQDVNGTSDVYKANTDLAKCEFCAECTDYCPQNVREIAGKQYKIEELVKIVLQDKVFYEKSGGGVTLSGGEVMAQDMDYIEELCKKIKEQGISLAIDTCGFAAKDSFMRILPYADLFLYDLKLIDCKKHEYYTGKSNEIILDNLCYLAKQKANIHIRIPIIPSVNDDEDSIGAFIDFIKEHVGDVQISLLPYHNTGSSKYDKLGRLYPAREIAVPKNEQMEAIKDRFEKAGFTQVKIGG